MNHDADPAVGGPSVDYAAFDSGPDAFDSGPDAFDTSRAEPISEESHGN
jgi:glycerol-3-phosphate dehydrogenase